MGRPKKLVPTKLIHAYVPQPLAEKLEAHLWSTVEDRVPYNAMSRFVTELLVGYFEMKSLDLSQHAPARLLVPPGSCVRGKPHDIETLETILKERLV